MPSVSAVTENTILPGLGLSSLRPDLIERARAQGPDAGLSDEAFLRRLEVARDDAETGETGILLPALLLFGDDEALRAALPEHGTAAHFRDARGRVTRETVRTNLLDTFDRLMAFAARHLPEAPHAESPEGLRDRVLAEIFINSLLHRDYTKPGLARFGIEPGRVYIENGSIGPSPDRPKNPVLSRLFTRMGWKRSTGGPSPLALWGRTYFGHEPMVFESGLYRLVAAYPAHGPADMQAARPKPAPRAFAAMREQARVVSVATTFPALRTRPSVRDLQRLLSESLPAFSMPLAPDPGAPRPAFFAAHASRTGDEPPAQTTTAGLPNRGETTLVRESAVSSSDRDARILKFCETPRHRSEIQEFAGFQNRDYFRKEILNPLIEQGRLAPTLPDKPNSPNQQYRATGR